MCVLRPYYINVVCHNMFFVTCSFFCPTCVLGFFMSLCVAVLLFSLMCNYMNTSQCVHFVAECLSGFQFCCGCKQRFCDSSCTCHLVFMCKSFCRELPRSGWLYSRLYLWSRLKDGSQRYQVLMPGACKCYLMWKEDLCRCD